MFFFAAKPRKQNQTFFYFHCRYRNEELLTDGGRIRTTKSEEGIFTLTILSTKPHDFGVYKCVARNKHGKVTCRARLMLGGQSIQRKKETFSPPSRLAE